MTHQHQTAFENMVGKGKIARNERFLLLLQCFLLVQIILSPFVDIFDITSLFAAEFDLPKIGISGKGLIFVSRGFLRGGRHKYEDNEIVTNFLLGVNRVNCHCMILLYTTQSQL